MPYVSTMEIYQDGLQKGYGTPMFNCINYEMIRWAIEGGCRIYDFRGVSGDLSPDNPLYGLYRFKKGFNGDFCEFCGQFTMIYKPLVSKGMDLAMKCHKKLRHMMAMKKSQG